MDGNSNYSRLVVPTGEVVLQRLQRRRRGRRREEAVRGLDDDLEREGHGDREQQLRVQDGERVPGLPAPHCSSC